MERQTDVEQPAKRSILSIPPALLYPAYRKYWFGTLGSVSGFQMVMFSQGWLVHQLEPSPLYLGYVGLANAIPAIGLNLFGGVFADKLDRRRLIMITQSIIASLIFVLATLTLLEIVKVWHVLIIAFAAGAVNAFDQPARQALYPALIDRKVMMSAVALNSSIWQGTRVVAPAMAGLVIAIANTATAFYIGAFGFVAMAIVIHGIDVPRVERRSTGSTGRDMLEGLKFIKGNSIFSFLIGMTFFNSFFGMAYITMMPIFTVDILGVGPDKQGYLLMAGGAGALMTTFILGSVGNFPRKGLFLIGGAAMFGLTVATFALTSHFVGWYALALVLMFFIGIFNSAYMISVMSSLQLMVPDHMRGRVMGFYGMVWSIMPLGAMQAGAVAWVVGTPFGVPGVSVAISIGGLAVSAFALGPAMINQRVRNIGTLLLQLERASEEKVPASQASSSDSDD